MPSSSFGTTCVRAGYASLSKDPSMLALKHMHACANASKRRENTSDWRPRSSHNAVHSAPKSA